MKKRSLEKLKPKPKINHDSCLQRIGAQIKALKIISESDPIFMRGFKRPTLEIMKKNIIDLIENIEKEIKFVEKLDLDKKNRAGIVIEINNFKNQRDMSNKVLSDIEKKIKELE